MNFGEPTGSKSELFISSNVTAFVPTIGNLKAAAQCLNFLTANGIKDMAGLDGKLQAMIDKQFSIREELEPSTGGGLTPNMFR